MNKKKLDEKLFELTKRFEGTDVTVKDLKDVIDALLDESEYEVPCPCVVCVKKRIKEVKNG